MHKISVNKVTQFMILRTWYKIAFYLLLREMWSFKFIGRNVCFIRTNSLELIYGDLKETSEGIGTVKVSLWIGYKYLRKLPWNLPKIYSLCGVHLVASGGLFLIFDMCM